MADGAPRARNTVQRSLVLEAVRSLHNHPNSRATVYRNLGVLADKGEVLHIPVTGGADRYDFRCDCHFHAICDGCGAVYDVEMPNADLLSQVKDSHGFNVTGYDLIFHGLCPDCA